jgi:hypothetical protein
MLGKLPAPIVAVTAVAGVDGSNVTAFPDSSVAVHCDADGQATAENTRPASIW